VAPNGVDAERFRPDERVRSQVRAELGAAPETVVGLFVGGDWHHKGLFVAIEALARARSAGHDGELWVVGRGDTDRARERAAQLGIEAHVRLLGHRRDADRFYPAADVFVLPTAYEAFSLVAHEAAASGLPLVVADVHGARELVGASEAGVVVERSAQAVADALVRLGADAALRTRLGAAARERARRLTWDESAAVFDAAYRRLLAEGEVRA
jgi:UDP-glucose:(heptosyl)LPS alpha-1,3-glucosyltransferase